MLDYQDNILVLYTHHHHKNDVEDLVAEQDVASSYHHQTCDHQVHLIGKLFVFPIKIQPAYLFMSSFRNHVVILMVLIANELCLSPH